MVQNTLDTEHIITYAGSAVPDFQMWLKQVGW